MTRTETLNDMIATYTKLIDDCVAEGDEESATELLNAVERACAELDALAA